MLKGLAMSLTPGTELGLLRHPPSHNPACIRMTRPWC